MKRRFITTETLEQFKQYLIEEEKSAATVEKYLRDTAAFVVFLTAREVTKELAISYKQKLIDEGYAVRSINSMLASLNGLFAFLGWYDCKVKVIKLQRQIFCSEDKGGVYTADSGRTAKEKRPPESYHSDDLRDRHSCQ